MSTGGLIREFEENRRQDIEQQAIVSSMPVKAGFGYEQIQSPISAISKGKKKGSSADGPAAALVSAAGSEKAKGKRRKTPEYTDSDDESG
jgi:chromodomain-helicase-DNA-binding protein 1